MSYRAPQQQSTTLALTTSINTTPELDFTHCTGGSVFLPSGSSITSLTWWNSSVLGGTYYAAQNASGASTTTVSGGKSYPIPAELFGSVGIKVVTDAAGSVAFSVKG